MQPRLSPSNLPRPNLIWPGLLIRPRRRIRPTNAQSYPSSIARVKTRSSLRLLQPNRFEGPPRALPSAQTGYFRTSGAVCLQKPRNLDRGQIRKRARLGVAEPAHGPNRSDCGTLNSGQMSAGYRWPYGPVVIIAPFNFPLEIPMLQLLGALYMGNKVLLKCESKVSVVMEQAIR